MTPTTLIMAYYENPGMLRRHYAMWREFSIKTRDLLHFIVVDDGSPKHPALPPEGELADYIKLQIYRVDVDVRWNQDACRNIGVHHSETNWVMLSDIDHYFEEYVWSSLLSKEWDPMLAYRFRRMSEPDMQPYKPHPNTWFMSRSLYDAAGGYDERFAGLYGTDGDFRDRVAVAAREIRQTKYSNVRVPREVTPDASTTSYLRKQPEDREGLARVRAERELDIDKTPKRLTFPYHRVFP